MQLYGRSGQTKVALQLILDEPPQRLYQKWIQDRMASYLRMEPMGASRDEALDLDYPVQERIRFSAKWVGPSLRLDLECAPEQPGARGPFEDPAAGSEASGQPVSGSAWQDAGWSRTALGV